MDIKLEKKKKKIKKDGIEEAEISSQELLKKGQAEATSIIDQAEKHNLILILHTGFGVKHLSDDLILRRESAPDSCTPVSQHWHQIWSHGFCPKPKQ